MSLPFRNPGYVCVFVCVWVCVLAVGQPRVAKRAVPRGGHRPYFFIDILTVPTYDNMICQWRIYGGWWGSYLYHHSPPVYQILYTIQHVWYSNMNIICVYWMSIKNCVSLEKILDTRYIINIILWHCVEQVESKIKYYCIICVHAMYMDGLWSSIGDLWRMSIEIV